MRQIVFDTETTGLEPSRESIIEIACVELVDRKIGETFHTYCRPRCRVSEGARGIHGISDEFLRDKPTFKEIYSSWAEFMKGADECIAHNAPFDVRFLDEEIARTPGAERFKLPRVVDTLAMARKKWPGKKNNLDAILQRLEIKNTRGEHHGALVDTQLLAEAYLAMTAGQEKIEFADRVVRPRPQGILAYKPSALTLSKVHPEEQKAHEEYCAMLKTKVW